MIYITESRIMLDKKCRIRYNPCVYEISDINKLQIDTEFDFELIEKMAEVRGLESLIQETEMVEIKSGEGELEYTENKIVNKIIRYAMDKMSDEYGCKPVRGGCNPDRAIVTCDDADGKYILIDFKITEK